MYSFVIPKQLLEKLEQIESHSGVPLRELVVRALSEWIKKEYEDDMRLRVLERSIL